jgi:hypothetical protein
MQQNKKEGRKGNKENKTMKQRIRKFSSSNRNNLIFLMNIPKNKIKKL